MPLPAGELSSPRFDFKKGLASTAPLKRTGTKLGQNFLIDEAAGVRIAEALGDVRERTVVEIGPGHGAITAHLAARCGALHCVEFDAALARELRFRFRNQPEVAVEEADILQADLRTFLPKAASKPALEAALEAPNGPNTLDVVGNLPYYITSEILLRLFGFVRGGHLRRAVLMVQREVAERLVASPGSREYGALSALAQLHGSVTELFTLPPGAFSPPPDVFSTVVRLDFAPRFEELGIAFEPFNRFLRSTFAQKRKTLANNLRAGGYTSDQIAAAWPPALGLQVRSEAVSLANLAELYRSLQARAETSFLAETPVV